MKNLLLILTFVTSSFSFGQDDAIDLALSQLRQTKRNLVKIRRTVKQEIENVNEAISILENSQGALDVDFYGVVSLKKRVYREGNSTRWNHHLRGTLIGKDARSGLTVDIMRNGKLVGSVKTKLSSDGKVIFKGDKSDFPIPNMYDLNRDFEVILNLENGGVISLGTTCEGKTEYTLNRYFGTYCKRD